MNRSVIRISLDLEETVSDEVIELHQGASATELRFSLAEGILPYSLDGVSLAVFSAVKPDGNEIANDCEIAEGYVSYAVTEQTVSLSGVLSCQLRLYGGDGTCAATGHFTVIVLPAPTGYVGIESTSEYLALDEMLSRAAKQFESYQLPSIGENGNWWVGDVDTGVRAAGIEGPQGIQGERGEPFSVSKVYGSVEEMNEGYASDGVAVGGFVVIETGDVEDEENARLYVKGNSAYEFLTDLSGARGMQGPQGIQGLQGPKGDPGDAYVLTASDKSEIVSEILASFIDASEVAM